MTQQALSYVLRLGASQDQTLQRVFGSVSRNITDTRQEIQRVQQTQRDLNAQLRNTERGTEEYQQLERQIAETRGEITRLTGELNEQQGSWDRLNQRRERFGRIARNGALAIGAAVGGLIVYAEAAGESAQQLLALERETGLSTDAIQRLQQQATAVGQSLDPLQLRRFSDRIGEIRLESSLAEEGLKSFGTAGESLLPASLALRAMGINATELSTQDLPALLRRLSEVEDITQRTTFAYDIFGRQLGTVAVAVSELDEETRASVANQLVSTRAQLESYAATRIEIQKFRNDLGEVTSALGQAFLPALTESFEALRPWVTAFAVWAEANPHILQAIALTGTAVVGLTALMWLLNTALAVRAALSGPAGWAALGVAAAVGGAALVGGAAIISSGGPQVDELTSLQDETRRQLGTLPEAVGVGARKGVEEGLEGRDERLQNTLENILPTAECAGRDAAQAVLEDTGPLSSIEDPNTRAQVATLLERTANIRVRPEDQGLPVSLQRYEFGPPREEEPVTRLPRGASIADTLGLAPSGIGTFIEMTNNIQTTETAEEVDTELRDAFSRYNLDR